MVTKLFSEDHNKQRTPASLTFLEAYEKDGDSLLNRVVTGEENCVKHVTCETIKSVYGVGTHKFSHKTKEMFANFVSKKDYGDRLWDREGVLLLDYVEPGSTIKSERYCETLKKLRRAIQNKRRGKMCSKVLFFHDNASPHNAIHTRELLDHFGWEVFEHPPYSPDFAPGHYHLLPYMKTWLATQRFDDDAELQAGVNEWLKFQAAAFYDDGINKIVHSYDKCLNLGSLF